VPDHRYPLMINGVPVAEAPEEIDICNAEQLRIVAARSGQSRACDDRGGWATPGILEAMKPGRMQGYGGTAEVPG